MTRDRLPVGTVTFLLTDIEASSRGWEADPGAMSKAVARHYQILDEAATRHCGVRPQEQGEGDSVVAVFARATEAVACALDIQRAMTAEPWPHGAEVRVRIGLHTGEARLRDEGNYFGEAIVRCARLRSVASGGQTLLSRATEELVVDQLPDGTTLKDLGPHRLKDLARPEHVFQLCHPDLDNEFPALRSLEVLPNNLPVQLTSFIGREAEIETVKALLEESRLVTLTGAGGSGKTRLALQLAAEVLETHPDGTWWVDLAPLSDPDLVPNAVAEALSIREVGGQSMTETLIHGLRDHRAAILLDNCEHLIGACARLVEALLHSCARLSIVATSREQLGVTGEISWRVPSLSLPDKNYEAAIESLTQFESVRLFLDRAVRARPNFVVTNHSAPAVAEICHRLDGIPLALELAAARVRVLTPEQIVDGLADRFRLLTGGGRTALPRQRTLEASIDWSYNLLTEPERLMFRRLAVFAGDFSLNSAEEVCLGDGIERLGVLDLLSSLVDRSLVQVEEDDAEARFRLLETIRAYARQKLADAGESPIVHDRHLEHFVTLAERAAPELERPDQLVWLQRIETETDNLRAALDWATEAHRNDEGMRLVAALVPYWAFRSAAVEGGRRLTAALAAGGGTPKTRARTMAWGAYVAVGRTDLRVANQLAEQALAIALEIGEPEIVALARFSRALGAVMAAEPDERPLMEAAAADAKEAGLESLFGRASSWLGVLAMRSGDVAAGRKHFDVAIPVATRSGDRFAEMMARISKGMTSSFVSADFAAGAPELSRGLELARSLHNGLWTTTALVFQASSAVLQGDFHEAERLVREAGQTAAALTDYNSGSTTQFFGAFLKYARGDVDGARAGLAETIRITLPLGYVFLLGPARAVAAAAALAAGDLDAARREAEEGIALAKRHPYAWVHAESMHCLAEVAFEEGDLGRAEDLEHEALGIWRRIECPPGVADVLDALARIASALESDAEAARLAAAAGRVRNDARCVRLPVDQPRHDELIIRLRARLGDEPFEAAWAEGSTLDLEAAVAYAERGRGERKRPSSGWSSLTPAELDVIRLAAQGLTNPQIAEKLFVTRATVKSHLGHIFAKLGVATRAELAAEATRRAI